MASNLNKKLLIPAVVLFSVGAYAQGGPFPPGDPVPITEGLLLLMAGGLLYGAGKKLRK
ncbi:hypothetical protein [Ascidiimonas aurantiaca]|uniref:hypothetical protein n=1 Tax=Ascidiimonas aurantiaca TaxID=1685432 RepID=UPI0030EF96E1